MSEATECLVGILGIHSFDQHLAYREVCGRLKRVVNAVAAVLAMVNP